MLRFISDILRTLLTPQRKLGATATTAQQPVWYFLCTRSTTGDQFAIGPATFLMLPTSADQSRAKTTVVVYNSGLLEPPVSDAGLKFWLQLFQIPQSEWPVGIS